MALPAYQDWAKFAKPGSDLVFGESVAAQTVYLGPVVDCSAWNWIILQFNNQDAAKYLNVNIFWAGYPVVVFQQPVDQITVGPGQTAIYAAPVRGRTAQVFFQSTTGAPTAGVRYNLIGTSHEVSKYSATTNKFALIDDTTAYGAGTGRLVSPTYWYEGPAQVALFTNNNTAAWVEFRYLDPDGVTTHDFAITQALSWPNSVPHSIWIPPAPIVAFINNQGAAQTIALHVTPGSISGG